MYSSDIKNLQELASVFTQMFKDANVNFVLSGCKAMGTNQSTSKKSYSEGYAYIDGKVCHVEGAENVSATNLKIVLKQKNGGNIPYVDGSYHPQYVEYYGEYSNDASVDSGYIAAYSYNGEVYFPDLRAFFKKYSVLKDLNGIDGYSPLQEISSDLKIYGILNAIALQSQQGLSLDNGDYNINVTDNYVSFEWKNGLSFRIDSSNPAKLYFKYKGSDDWVEFGSIIPTNGIIPYLKNFQADDLYVKNLYVNGGDVPGTIPLGGVISYAGRLDRIPIGFALCDGRKVNCLTTENGHVVANKDLLPIFDIMGGVETSESTKDPKTGEIVVSNWTKYFMMPDLRGRFIVGYDRNKADYSSIGNTGGEAFHTLNVKEMPQHKHAYNKDDLGIVSSLNNNYSLDVTLNTVSNTAASSSASEDDDLGLEIMHPKRGDVGLPRLVGTVTTSDADVPSTKAAATDNTGAGQPHENRPPYYTLAYIMRII